MGVKGLLKHLRPITIKEDFKNFRGKYVAVDESSWLYISAIGLLNNLTPTESDK